MSGLRQAKYGHGNCWVTKTSGIFGKFDRLLRETDKAMARIVYLATPWLPTGGHWLINCLLESGVKVSTYRCREKDWLVRDGRHYVGAYERFKSYIPAFSDNESFLFRDDVEVIWGHVFPYKHMLCNKVTVFTRDPRDALYLQYRREKDMVGAATYKDWLRWPFHESLLDAVDNWDIFHRLWLKHPSRFFCRYEDYKADARATFEQVLDHLGIEVAPERVEQALNRSSYERYLERQGRPLPAPGTQVMDFWRNREGEEECVAEIEKTAATVMRALGYELTVGKPAVAAPDIMPHMLLNPFFRDIAFGAPPGRVNAKGNLYIMKVIAFYRILQKKGLSETNEIYRECHTCRELLENMAAYIDNCKRVGIIR